MLIRLYFDVCVKLFLEKVRQSRSFLLSLHVEQIICA